MMVTAVIPVDKRKSKVFLEEGFAFVLYRGEVERYRIEEGRELEDTVYEEILRDILCPRSKEYALHLLKDSGKTEKWMKEKLGKAGYPKEAVEYAVNFLKEYHFLDDNAYVFCSHLKMSMIMQSNVTGLVAHPCDYYELTADLDIN